MIDYDPEHTARVERRTREARETALFGATVAVLRADIESVVGAVDVAEKEEVGKVVVSILSDAQEMIRMKLYEQGRQAINRAKWIVFEYVATKKIAPLPLTVLKGGDQGGSDAAERIGEPPPGDS